MLYKCCHGIFKNQKLSIIPNLSLLVLLSFPASARIKLYSHDLADSLKTADSLRRTDARWISDSTLKARYFAKEAKKQPGIRLYSRTQIERKVIDSVKIVDSIRVADSIQTVDSITISRYRTADGTLSNEKDVARRATEAALEVKKHSDSSSATVATPEYSDNLSARMITIAPDNPFAPTIDSIQAVIDHFNDSIHDNDSYFKKMKVFPISEKQRYIAFLLENHLKDSVQVLSFCTAVFELYKMKQTLLVAIRNSQDVNTKSFISYHLEVHLQKMGELSELLLSLTPKVPFGPEMDGPTGRTRE